MFSNTDIAVKILTLIKLLKKLDLQHNKVKYFGN